jgi:hypothetical protein
LARNTENSVDVGTHSRGGRRFGPGEREELNRLKADFEPPEPRQDGNFKRDGRGMERRNEW